MTDLDLAIELLKLVKCPICDGSGVIIVGTYSIEAGCCGNTLPTGECCGNSIAVQVPTQVLEQCQWCAEREELVSKYDS
jgi:hypothetical protein